MPLLVSIAAAILWIVVVASSQQPVARMVGMMVVAFGITGLTSAFQVLPMAEYGRLAVRWVGTGRSAPANGSGETVPYELHKEHSLKPVSLLGLVIPGIEHSAYDSYVGGVTLTLGFLGMVLGWKDFRVRWLAGMSLGGILFALGPNSVFHGVMYAVLPMIDKARVPAAGSIVFMLGLAPLAAFGIDRLGLPESFGVTRRAGFILAGFAAVLMFGSLFFYAAKVTPAISDNRMVITAFAAVLLAACWRASGREGFRRGLARSWPWRWCCSNWGTSPTTGSRRLRIECAFLPKEAGGPCGSGTVHKRSGRAGAVHLRRSGDSLQHRRLVRDRIV